MVMGKRKTKRKPSRKANGKNGVKINGWANLILIIIITVGMVSFIIAGDNRNERSTQHNQQCIEKIGETLSDIKGDVKLLLHKVEQLEE